MNPSDTSDSSLPLRASDLLATGLGTATAMWIAGYVLHMPLMQPHVPPWIVFAVLVLVMWLGGYVFGRDSFRGWRIAWLAPIITALVNMLIFSSVLKGENRDALMVSLPGFFGLTLVVMLTGFAAGKARRSSPPPLGGVGGGDSEVRDRAIQNRASRDSTSPRPASPGGGGERNAHWRLRLAWVPVLATALVVSAGGLVTGFDAGFSVPDWPGTYHTNMFLYPISHMTGGIYYEHAHRLAGTLVGFTAIVLMIWTWIADRRWAVRLFTTLALLMVVAQGVAGGLWVESASLPYILFHGSFGQMILATFAVLAATHAPSWRKQDLPLTTPSASTDHWLTVLLLLAFIVQTLLGVYVRKSPAGPLMMHMTFAAVVVALVVAVTLRGLMLYRKRLPPIKRVCNGLLHGTTFQVLLGISALIVRQHNQGVYLKPGDPTTTSPLDATITTLHQSIGAFLLAFAALAVAWNRRLIRKPKAQ
ncbi:MAG: COX15/CtaA family protein [Phycisphaerales bacterium]